MGGGVKPRWQAVDAEVGVALWRALQPLIGTTPGVHVGATCTTDDYVLTEVWAGDAPLLRCESRYVAADRDEDGVLRRGAGEHAYAVPVPLDDEAGDEATMRGVAHERAAIVAFLRRPCLDATHDDRWWLEDADIIEGGEHHESPATGGEE